jgi:hypothetical protein
MAMPNSAYVDAVMQGNVSDRMDGDLHGSRD